MKKKGFTLIELLAVIVILAIIAVIATPIILGIVENTRKEAFQRSVELIVKATDINISSKSYEENYTYTLTDGVISDDVKVTNTEGMNGNIVYDSEGQVEYAVHNGKYCVKKTKDMSKSEISEYLDDNCFLPGAIFTITYNLNGGVNAENAVKTFTSETSTFSLSKPIKAGYVFRGWTGSNGDEASLNVTIPSGTTGNKVYSANWEEIVDGTIIYFDVANGKLCDNYNEDNSITEYNGVYEGDNSRKTTDNQNSCLKFYAFNYDEGDTVVNLLLDHNTEANTYWSADYLENAMTNGPLFALDELKEATNSWVGTEVPADYELQQENYANYVIDYDNNDDTLDYKARLITANEIAEITGNLSFDERTTDYNGWYSFDENCGIDDKSGCEHGWLYDRTATNCEDYGCLNNATGTDLNYLQGYWTATLAFNSSGAWGTYEGSGYLTAVDLEYYDVGIRPVIEVVQGKL